MRESTFWERVDKLGPIHPTLGQCWTWTGFKLPNGYGKSSSWLAHRYSWTLHNGKIPDGMSVLHHCDNVCCVNPQHLFIGTQSDNVADMLAKGRGCTGEKQGAVKLTNEQVFEIRRRYRRYSHKHGSGALARKFGVSVTEVWRIVKRERWQHI